jgi:hypothetical protein
MLEFDFYRLPKRQKVQNIRVFQVEYLEILQHELLLSQQEVWESHLQASL